MFAIQEKHQDFQKVNFVWVFNKLVFRDRMHPERFQIDLYHHWGLFREPTRQILHFRLESRKNRFENSETYENHQFT